MKKYFKKGFVVDFVGLYLDQIYLKCQSVSHTRRINLDCDALLRLDYKSIKQSTRCAAVQLLKLSN